MSYTTFITTANAVDVLAVNPDSSVVPSLLRDKIIAKRKLTGQYSAAAKYYRELSSTPVDQINLRTCPKYMMKFVQDVTVKSSYRNARSRYAS